MNFLWGLIGSLQIIINIAVFSFNFPANTLNCFTSLAAIQNFNYFNPAIILGWFFNFDPNPQPFNNNFNSFGFTTMNLIENLGT